MEKLPVEVQVLLNRLKELKKEQAAVEKQINKLLIEEAVKLVLNGNIAEKARDEGKADLPLV